MFPLCTPATMPLCTLVIILLCTSAPFPQCTKPTIPQCSIYTCMCQGTGYCWCVDPVMGRPVAGSTMRADSRLDIGSRETVLIIFCTFYIANCTITMFITLHIAGATSLPPGVRGGGAEASTGARGGGPTPAPRRTGHTTGSL